MGFEGGALSLTMYYVPRQLPADCVKRFAADALPPLDVLGREPLYGWVTGRHLLDRQIDEETARVAGRLRLTLVKAERKIPEALLRAECKMEEFAVMAAEDLQFVDRQTRIRIKKEVAERLLPTMPPTLTGIDIVHDPEASLVCATATSDKQIDALTLGFEQAVGVRLIPLNPGTAAMKRKKVNVRDVERTSFSPECPDELAGDDLGMDFLTWLWFFSEDRGGALTVGGHRYAVMLEGPLAFFMEGDGAHVTVLRDGQPLVSSEAKAALLAGKKLRSAKVVIADGGESWTAGVDADFVFRGLRLPKGEALDPTGRFEERMLSFGRFRDVFLSFFDRFLDERAAPAAWAPTRAAIHAWVSGRVAKA
jgi:recombination associated protein RdgC